MNRYGIAGQCGASFALYNTKEEIMFGGRGKEGEGNAE